MSVMTMDYLNKPDKRKKKTSLYQYKQYLKALEDDEIFRTGFIPPGQDANYLSTKWNELANKLNEDEKGPKLSAEAWKKRLMDWKHTTRAKERRINEGNTHLRMTPLELRFMELWGCAPTIINVSTIKSINENTAEIKLEKGNESEKSLFEELLEQPENKQDLDKKKTSHEYQFVSATGSSEPQITLTTSTSSTHDIKVVEQIRLPVQEKKIQNCEQSAASELTTLTHNTIEKRNENRNLTTPPPLKRMRVNNVSQAHISQIPISNDYNQSNNLNANTNVTMNVTSSTLPTQINTTRQNLQILTQTLTTPQSTLSNGPDIAYTINTLPPESESIPVIDVQSIALQLKRLADMKEQKLKFEIEKFKFKNPGFKYDF